MSRRQPRDPADQMVNQLVSRLLKSKRPGLLLGLIALLAVVLLLGYLKWGPEGKQPPEVEPNAPRQAAGIEGWYELHFTRPLIPTDRSRYQGGLDARLVELMNRATRTLDVAVYDFDLENVAEAMVAARQRGVRVRLVTDSDTVSSRNKDVQEALAILRKAEIPLVADQRSGIMHHKFTVVDGAWVQTGSWNYTVGDTYRLNNNMIVVHSPELAANYTAEFEKMFVQGKFGAKKPRGVPHPVLTIGESRVQNYFAPKDRVADRILETVEQARESILFLAFSFTHDGIGNAMLAKAAAGVKVSGVFEKTGSQTPASEYGKMKAAGLEVYTDGSPYAMHHKVIIVDERTVVFGSFNFSQSADKDNDENVLIVDDLDLAKAFKEEYERMVEWARNPPKRK